MNFIPVKTFDSYVTANIWLGKLQDAGVRCYLKDEYTVTIDPVLTNAIGGIKLCVDELQLDECRQLIDAFEQQGRQRQQCPSCGSLDVQYISRPGPTNWITALLSWLIGSYAVGANKVYHCFHCGKEFDEIQNEELNLMAAT